MIVKWEVQVWEGFRSIPSCLILGFSFGVVFCSVVWQKGEVGLVHLLCAGVAENAYQPTFYVEPYICFERVLKGCKKKKT